MTSGCALLHADVAGELVEQAVEVGPERLLAQVAAWPERDADDLRAGADRLERP